MLAKTILAEIDSGKVRSDPTAQHYASSCSTRGALFLSATCSREQPGSHDSSTTGLLKAYLGKVRHFPSAPLAHSPAQEPRVTSRRGGSPVALDEPAKLHFANCDDSKRARTRSASARPRSSLELYVRAHASQEAHGLGQGASEALASARRDRSVALQPRQPRADRASRRTECRYCTSRRCPRRLNAPGRAHPTHAYERTRRGALHGCDGRRGDRGRQVRHGPGGGRLSAAREGAEGGRSFRLPGACWSGCRCAGRPGSRQQSVSYGRAERSVCVRQLAVRR